MALSLIRQLTQIIRSRPVLGGMEREICSLKYPKLPQSLIWTWGSTYRRGMPTVPLYHVEREADYNAYYLAQLKEILSNPAYGNEGKFAEVWMDGARGEGAQKVNYEFEKWFETIRDLQGDCLIFSTEGTSIRWIGNERGYAGDPLWQKVNPDKLGTEAELDYLQNGDPSGTIFSIGEADVSIRPGWFYHEDQDPKSLEELVEIYFHSVGRGTPLLLNIPPNQDGLFDEKDIERLYEFAAYRNELYKEDLALGAKVSGPALSRRLCLSPSDRWPGKQLLGKRCRLAHPVRTRLRIS